MKKFNAGGFTLVEMLFSLMIFIIIVGGLYTAFNSGSRAWSKYQNNITLQRDARGALTVMTKDMREATGLSITQNATSAAVSFSTSLGSVSYSWTTTGGNANKIIRVNGAMTRTIANNISALAFTDSTSAVLVDITASKPQTTDQVSNFRLREKIAKR